MQPSQFGSQESASSKSYLSIGSRSRAASRKPAASVFATLSARWLCSRLRRQKRGRKRSSGLLPARRGWTARDGWGPRHAADKIVCSELVYKAYQSPEPDAGLHFELLPVAGRRVLSPNDIVRKFAAEEGEEPQLEFVLFLDGNEHSSRATPKDAQALRASCDRPKWDFLQQ